MTEPAAPAVADAAAITARVQGTFERIRYERMAGLPFLNEALHVELVGPRRWRGLWLGVLITPWFMNVMLLPGDGAAAAEGEATPLRWPTVATGEYAQFDFPAGTLSFLAGREGEMGEYLSCSLFSPMFGFADHAGARQTAQACLLALLDPRAAAAQVAAGRPADAPAQPGKRDFLRGRWHDPAAWPAER
jgi:[NiFe] hydrogenase assembly HybE family chaperone